MKTAKNIFILLVIPLTVAILMAAGQWIAGIAIGFTLLLICIFLGEVDIFAFARKLFNKIPWVRISIVLSLLWVLSMVANPSMHRKEIIYYGLMPMVVLWGIWWIIKKKKDEP